MAVTQKVTRRKAFGNDIQCFSVENNGGPETCLKLTFIVIPSKRKGLAAECRDNAAYI